MIRQFVCEAAHKELILGIFLCWWHTPLRDLRILEPNELSARTASQYWPQHSHTSLIANSFLP